MKAYSLDLRRRVLSSALRGDRAIPEVAELSGVSMAFVNKMLRLHRAGLGLAPRPRKGDVAVLDNPGAHRASRVEEVAEARGAQALWVAPYSPDYSPIEQCRSKIRSNLRGAKARTQEQPDQALAAAINLVTKADIRGWFRHCGYSLARVCKTL